MVLLALIMTLLLGSMRIGADSWDQGERMAERAARLAVVNNFFRSSLSDAKPLFEAPDPSKAGMPPKLTFSGGPTWLNYAGTLPPQVRGGLYKFHLYLAEEGERSDLKLAMRPFSTGEKGGDEPIEDVLVLENVVSLQMEYYKKDSLGGKSQWMEEWKENVLPALVRIKVVLRGEPPWPPIVVAPRVEAAQ